MKTNIPLVARFEPIAAGDDRPPTYADPTLALAVVMIAIEDDFGGGLLDDDFRATVAAAKVVDDDNRARWSQHISRTIG